MNQRGRKARNGGSSITVVTEELHKAVATEECGETVVATEECGETAVATEECGETEVTGEVEVSTIAEGRTMGEAREVEAIVPEGLGAVLELTQASKGTRGGGKGRALEVQGAREDRLDTDN